MKKLLSAALVALATMGAHAQYFEQLYGTSGNDGLTDGHMAYNGGNNGHFMVGTTPAGSVYHLLAIRTDINGSSTSGAPYFNNGYKIYDNNTFSVLNILNAESFEFSNGSGYGIVGSYYDPNAQYYGVYFLNLDPVGNVVGAYGYTDIYKGGLTVTSVTESVQNNNDFYICGIVRNPNQGIIGNVFVIKASQNGTWTWAEQYDLNTNVNTNFDVAMDIVESAYPNNGTYEVLVAGQYFDNSSTPGDGFVLRIDYNNGTITAPVDLYGGTTSTEGFFSIKNSVNTNITGSGDGYVLGGYSDYTGNTGEDFWFMAMDLTGNVAWSYVYDYDNYGNNGNNNLCRDIIERINSSSLPEYYLAGHADFGVYGMLDYAVVKTDDWGNAVGNGQFTFGDSRIDICVAVDQLNINGTNPPDGLSLYGTSENNSGYNIGGSGYDYYLVKSYFSGHTNCNYDLQNPIQNSGPGFNTQVTASFLDWLMDVQLGASIFTATENNICFGNTVGGGSNARQALAAQLRKDDDVVVVSNPLTSGSSQVDLNVKTHLAGKADIRVVDMLGRECYRGSALVTTGTNRLQLNTGALKPGNYLVYVSSTGLKSHSLLLVK